MVEKLKSERNRILVDDELGVSIDISDLEYYVYSFDFTEQKTKKVKISTLHHPKKKANILRVTLANGIAADVSENTLFHVRDKEGNMLYVRADRLKPGMDVLTGITPDGPGVIIY